MKKTLVTLLLGSVFAAPALAADAGTAYGAIDLGTWSLDTSSNPNSFPNTGAMAFSVGYRFTPNMAVEGGLVIAGQSTLSNFLGSLNYQQSAFKIAAVGSLPLSSSFSLFGKLGLASVRGHLTGTGLFAGSDSAATTTNLLIGFGAQVELSQNVALRLQIEGLGKSTYDPTLEVGKATLSTLGVTFTF